ncbi:MAG TPA: arginine N-succinyltransferase [Polyangia bacterium]|nr:arginine N-succinyltransferase [Polyangia bacterium]
MFSIREVFPDDLEGLHRVAAHLDTVNLPDDRAVLEKLIDQSRRSFNGQLDVFKREYLFVLLDDDKKEIIGTSMIHAQHGTRRSPHIFFDVMQDERYSETLDKHFVHKVLRIGYNYNGPTEIGGLVLMPEYRRNALALGKWLSYVRFLYIGLHRASFRDEVLSELLPPLEADGSSVMWENIGRHFTGMSYQEADRISQTNKEFIRTLFPAEPIYLSLFPKKVQEVIGQVGAETKGVEKMLRRIGFDYAERIDPFDGGPHFVAKTDEITLVTETRKARVVKVSGADDGRPYGLVSVERDRAPHFSATGSRFRLEGTDVGLPEKTMAALGVGPGDEVGVLSFA